MSNTLRYYACGETKHELSQVLKGHPKESRTFPSGVFLFEHESGDKVLFDTGYAPSLNGTGLLGKLYGRLLPPEVKAGDTIDQQLLRDNVDPHSISRVVLSHVHPDHIGGVRYFPQAKFIMSKDALETIARPRMRDGLLPGLLPDWFRDAPKIILENQTQTHINDTLHGYDVFDDKSYIVVHLPGHAKGHIGALVMSQALLAGDAAWGSDLLGCAEHMRMLPRAITHDTDAYIETAGQLRMLQE